MKADRFRQLWMMRGIDGCIPHSFRMRCDCSTKTLNPNGLTEAENAEVLAEWETMPGYTCWMQAFHKLWRKAEEQEKDENNRLGRRDSGTTSEGA